MPWSRGSLLVALLALHIPFAIADTVIVDTTADDSNASTCSLRDAVAYLNIPAATRPASHANGCEREGAASTDNVITIPYSAAPYIISNGVVEVDSSITINGESSADDAMRNPFVWVQSNQAIRIDGPQLTADLGASSAALQLNATSDTGVSDSDRHTYVRNPSFSGTGASPSTLLCLLARKEGQPVSGYEVIASANSDAAGAWSMQSSVALGAGVNDIALIEGGGGGCVSPTVEPSQALKISIYTVSAVNISKVDLVSCGAPLAKLPAHIKAAGVVPGSCTGTEGGVFYVNELLYLDSVAVRGGRASQGGIVYVGDEGVIRVSASSLLQGNAAEGSAVYIAPGGVMLQMYRSLVAENTGGSEAIRFASRTNPVDYITTIENTTFHGNEGRALLLQDKVTFNGVTITGNSIGAIDFGISDLSAATSKVFFFNSIISGDCTPVSWPATAADAPSYNLVDSSCAFPASQNTISDSNLVAVVDSDGSCQGDSSGVLCPRDKDFDGVNDYFVPRFLPTVAQGGGNYSDIINKGSTGSLVSACPAGDQQDSERGAAGRCDIGAVEFQYVTGSISSGDVLVAGFYEQLFATALLADSDEELFLPVDPTVCPVVLPTAPLSGAAAGCPWLSVTPIKGRVRLSSDRKGYFYEAASSYHGTDTFRIEITTTASRLNDNTHETSQTRGINVLVINEPVSGIESDSVLDGGAVDWLALSALIMLLTLRRTREEAIRV